MQTEMARAPARKKGRLQELVAQEAASPPPVVTAEPEIVAPPEPAPEPMPALPDVVLAQDDDAEYIKKQKKRPILDRVGLNAAEFASQCPPELAAARLKLLSWIDAAESDEPQDISKPNVTIDRWLGMAIAERIKEFDVRNRRQIVHHIEFMAGQILRREWHCNGENFKFSVGGQCIDGQHRDLAFLLACKKDPTLTITTDLRFRVPKEAMKTLDTGRSRKASDLLGMAGYANTTVIAGMARLWDSYHRGTMKSNPKLSNLQVSEVANDETYEELFHPACLLAINTHRKKTIPVTVLAFVAALGLRADEKLTREFFEQITTGENLKRGYPSLVLLKACQNRQEAARGKAWRIELAALTIKALNAHFLGRTVGILSWKDSEDFPKFVGDNPNWRSLRQKG